MNANGLVLAASSTSLALIPRLSQTCDSSLARLMFTKRKVFSNTLAVSATSGEDTGYTFATTLS